MNRATYTIGIASILITSLIVGAAATGLVGYGISSSSSPKDFRLFAAQKFLNPQPGASGQTAVTVVSLNGFSGQVKLSTTITPSISGAPTVSLNPSTLRLRSGGAANSTLTVSTTKTTPTLNYTLTVVAQSGKLSHSVLVVVFIPPPDFSLSLFPNAMSLALGSSGNSIATVSSLNGFSGTIILSISNIPVNTGVGVAPAQLTLPVGGNVSSTVFVNVDTNAFPGTYAIIISATSAFAGGFLTHTAVLALTISPGLVPDFSITASPVFLTVQRGSTGFGNVTLQSIGGFNGTVSLTGSIIPTIVGGPVIMFSPSSTFLAAGSTATPTIVIITNTTTLIGFYNYTITGTSGTVFHTFVGSLSIIGTNPDFTFSLVPSSETVPLGSSRDSHYEVTSLNGFSGTITVRLTSIEPIPICNPGVTCDFALGTSDATVTPGGNATGNIFVGAGSNTIPGTYSLTLTSTGGSIAHTAILVLTISTTPVPDFFITTSPSFLSLPAGSMGLVNVTIASIGGFNGTVSLAGSIIPAISGGPTALVSPANVFLNSGSIATSVLEIITNTNTPVGIYNYTVTGSAGFLFHTVGGQFKVAGSASPDFVITAHPSSLQILQGSSQRDFLNITSVGGFSGTINLNATVSPLGPRLVLAANSVTLSLGGTMTIVLAVFTNTTVPIPLGNYTITVVGASGSLVHSVNIELSVIGPAREGLLFENYAFNSSTAVTLYLMNIGNTSINLVSYYVRDASGNQYALTSWAGPTLTPGSLTGVLILIGSSCPGCVLTGSAFTFTPGNSYAITVVTSRNNQFTFTVVR